MASERPTGLAALAVLAALSCTATGCTSATPTAQRAAAAPEVGTVPTLDNTRARKLPVEKYLISPQENAKIESARSALMTSCMKRFGFTFKPATPDYGQKWDQTSHRYDPTDPALAAAHGYHGPRRGTQAGAQRPARKPMSSAMEVVLGHGLGAPTPPGGATPPADGKYHGLTIPKGGCMGEAEAKLTRGGGIIQDAPGAVDINFKDYVRSMADPKLKAAFAKWSSCMKEKGFSYPTPEAAVKDPAWNSPKPSKHELATAAADVDCKRRNNVVGTWFAVEAAYETRDIQSDIKKMTRIRNSIDIAVRNAAAAPAGS
ncbi:hypothetical protein [Streptomyces sp. IBSBF 3136]|uniref:hypothetical protein n=1 Tax=Streptomyces sp. IBSBF 3136 TaxID=2903524 RepID=UPI002FDC2C07